MKQLDVLLIQQPEKSVDCGIASVAMILQYFGKNISFDEAKKNLVTDEIGTYMPQLGKYLLDQGLKVKIISFHQSLFNKAYLGASREKVIDRITTFCELTKSEKDKKVASYFLDYFKSGGDLEVKIPSFDDVKRSIDNNKLLLAPISSNLLFDKGLGANFHANVITGYDNESVYVNDPDWKEPNFGKHKHPVENFFYSLYATALGDIDNASLMVVEK